jgi:hypothetical protein
MVGARRAIASRVGAAVVGRRDLRAAADDRGRPHATIKGLLREESRHKNGVVTIYIWEPTV